MPRAEPPPGFPNLNSWAAGSSAAAASPSPLSLRHGASSSAIVDRRVAAARPNVTPQPRGGNQLRRCQVGTEPACIRSSALLAQGAVSSYGSRSAVRDVLALEVSRPVNLGTVLTCRRGLESLASSYALSSTRDA